MTKKLSKKAETLVAGLFSADQEKVVSTLEKIPHEGEAALIIPLLKTYREWYADETIRTAISKIMMELKTEAAIPALIAALNEPEFEADRAFIISVFWNAGLFPVDDVNVLVRHAILGDYLVTLEALTVIENIESKIPQETVQESILDIEEYLDDHPEEQHSELLVELKQVLTSLYNL